MRSRAQLIGVAVLLALDLVRCTSHRPAPDPSSVGAQLGDLTGVSVGELPSPADWTAPPGVSLDDGLTIDEAVAAALWNNREFQAALASLGVSRADVLEAGLLRNPVLSLLFPLGPKQLEATLLLPIDAFWLRPRRIREAEFRAEIVAEDLVRHGLDLAAEVKQAYVEAWGAGRALAVATEQARLARQAADLSTSRLRAGEISQFESRLTTTDAARAEASRIARSAARDLALVRLHTLLGLEPGQPTLQLMTPPDSALEACGPRDALASNAMAARPDVRAAELAIDAAGARAGLERARVLALTASLDANAEGSQGFEAGPGLAVELPLFARNQGGRARAEAELEQASRRYVAVRARVQAEVASAFVRLTEAEAAKRVLSDEAASTAALARTQAQGLYEAGEISLLDLIDARQRLLAVETTNLDAELAAARALIQLEAAVGRPCAH